MTQNAISDFALKHQSIRRRGGMEVKLHAYLTSVPDDGHVMWVPVTTAWRVLGLRMKKTASRYGG
jgi:hypothetical protein